MFWTMDAGNRKSLRTTISNFRNKENICIVYSSSLNIPNILMALVLFLLFYYFTISISKRLKKNLQNIKEESNKGNCWRNFLFFFFYCLKTNVEKVLRKSFYFILFLFWIQTTKFIHIFESVGVVWSFKSMK